MTYIQDNKTHKAILKEYKRNFIEDSLVTEQSEEKHKRNSLIRCKECKKILRWSKKQLCNKCNERDWYKKNKDKIKNDNT